MKSHKTFLLFSIACSILLLGCPYEAKFPLSNSNESAIDTTLIGSWNEILNKTDEQSSSIEVDIFNSHEYFVQTLMREKGSMMVQGFRAFETTTNHQKFLNIQEIGNKPKFNFYKYYILADTLKIYAVSDGFSKTQFNNAEELANYFFKNMNDSKFYEQERLFVKRKK